MSLPFEELDYQQTRMGELILRRRVMRMLDDLVVYEVILGDAFLMSSLFTTVEIALADLGLAALGDRSDLEVVVGGLGLGYTAQAALANDKLTSLLVVDALEEVIGWHRDEKVPVGAGLNADPRCRYVHGDFFAMAADSTTGFDPDHPGRRFDAVLLDIDHTPSYNLDPSHADFYTKEGLTTFAEHLKPEGVFAMWADGPPDDEFTSKLGEAFDKPRAHLVKFPNPLLDKESCGTVYVAHKR
jgi:spermidine synthase